MTAKSVALGLLRMLTGEEQLVQPWNYCRCNLQTTADATYNNTVRRFVSFLLKWQTSARSGQIHIQDGAEWTWMLNSNCNFAHALTYTWSRCWQHCNAASACKVMVLTVEMCWRRLLKQLSGYECQPCVSGRPCVPGRLEFTKLCPFTSHAIYNWWILLRKCRSRVAGLYEELLVCMKNSKGAQKNLFVLCCMYASCLIQFAAMDAGQYHGADNGPNMTWSCCRQIPFCSMYMGYW